MFLLQLQFAVEAGRKKDDLITKFIYLLIRSFIHLFIQPFIHLLIGQC